MGQYLAHSQLGRSLDVGSDCRIVAEHRTVQGLVIVVSQSQSQVIVGGTLIRRSPLGVTDTHLEPALTGMTLV